jgi:hypothetical protein
MKSIRGTLLSQEVRILVAFLGLVLAASAQNAPNAQTWKAVEDAMGRTAQVQPDGVARFGMPRTDLKVNISSIELQPGFALGSWAAFRRAGANTMVTGDLVLLESEVPQVMSAILKGGMQVSALHNHLINETPGIMYMHIHGNGDAVEMAKTVHDAVALTSTPMPGAPTTSSPPQFDLDTDQIGKALGSSGKVNNGILQFSIPRPEKITEHGVDVPPTMGLGTAINFQPTGEKRAAITGDFVLLANEVNPVMQSLREDGIVVTAVHNHMLEESPRLFFMHFWAEGDANRLAQSLGAALAKTAMRR